MFTTKKKKEKIIYLLKKKMIIMKPELFSCKKCGTLFQTKYEARNCKHTFKVIDKVWGSKIVKFPTNKKKQKSLNKEQTYLL